MKSALDFPSGQSILYNVSGTIYEDLLGNEQDAGQFVCNILDGSWASKCDHTESPSTFQVNRLITVFRRLRLPRNWSGDCLSAGVPRLGQLHYQHPSAGRD